jgi:Family of unknown function (DUF6502)
LSRSKPTKSKSLRSSRSAKTVATTGVSPAEVLQPLLWLLEAVGVPRREVLATIQALPKVKLPRPVKVVRGQLAFWSLTLIRWAADPQFLGQDGRPRDLAFATGDASFSDLVAMELPGERPAMCRDVLLAAKAIIRLPNGRLRLRERAALATGAESGVVLADEYLRPLRALLLVLQTALLRRARGGPEVAFQRAVSGFAISGDDMAQLHSFVARHGTAFLESVDDWLAQRDREQQRGAPRGRISWVRPYLGLYLGTDSDSSRLATQPDRNRLNQNIPALKGRRTV